MGPGSFSCPVCHRESQGGTCLLSAVRGGWPDEVFLCFKDVLLVLPEIIVALPVIAVLGPGSVH